MENKLPIRKSIRLKDFDYSSGGAYFITICTRNRQKILSRIVGGDVPGDPNIDVLGDPKDNAFEESFRVELLKHGEIADKYINQLNDFYDDMAVMKYVIMPDHIHLLLFVIENESGAPRTSHPTNKYSRVANFVSTFKRFCNKEYGEKIWQRYFYDHIIRNQADYEENLKYIYENPMRWYCNNKLQ